MSLSDNARWSESKKPTNTTTSSSMTEYSFGINFMGRWRRSWCDGWQFKYCLVCKVWATWTDIFPESVYIACFVFVLMFCKWSNLYNRNKIIVSGYRLGRLLVLVFTLMKVLKWSMSCCRPLLRCLCDKQSTTLSPWAMRWEAHSPHNGKGEHLLKRLEEASYWVSS